MEQATRRRNNHDTEEFKINEEATKHYAAYIDRLVKPKLRARQFVSLHTA